MPVDKPFAAVPVAGAWLEGVVGATAVVVVDGDAKPGVDAAVVAGGVA